MTGFRLCGVTFAFGCFLAMGGEEVALPDFQAQTSSGPVSFHDVVVKPGRQVNGVVTNLTDRKWTAVVFDFELVDSAGKTVGHAPLIFRNFERGQSRELAVSVPLLNTNKQEFAGYRLEYLTGEVELTYVLTMLEPERSRLLKYEDEDAAVSFSVSDTCINVKLKNRSSSAMTVDWSGARFVDILEKSHPVRHIGDGTGNVIPFGSLAASIEPIFESPVETGEYAGWRSGRVLPRTDDAGVLKGKIVSLVLPVEVGGVRRSYRFVFQVAEILYQ